jgi:Glycosyl hydrolases family 39/Beta-galactosidase
MPRRVLLFFTAVLLGCAAFAGTASAASHHRTVKHARVCHRTVRVRTRHGKMVRRRVVVRCARTAPAKSARRLAVATSAPKSGSKSGSKSARSINGALIVGINANVSGWGDASTQPRLAQVTSQTHTKWLRETFRWDLIEPSPGQFDFAYYDHFMLLAAQAGEHILPVLYYTPSWAGATYDTIPSDPSAYAQYVAAVVGRYGTNGSFWKQYPTLSGSAIQTWELWNEPYYSTGDNGDYNPGNYARLVKAADIAGRAADPNAKFLLASEMQSAQDANGNWQWWTDALYQAVPDLNNYFDGVAVHPYGTNTTTLNPEPTGQPYNNYDSMMRIQDIHQQFINHGAADKPFWITEIGWSTCTTNPQCVTPAQQATNLTNLFADLHGSWAKWVQAAFLYHYTDGANPTGNIEDGYGLTTNTTTPKPALTLFQTQAAQSAT